MWLRGLSCRVCLLRLSQNTDASAALWVPTCDRTQLFPDVNDGIKRRENLMLDYDELRTKVKKLVEKPSQDPTKLPMVRDALQRSLPKCFFFLGGGGDRGN